LPGKRNIVRNNARCTQARKTTHGMDIDNIKTWTGLPAEESMGNSELQRIEINGESTSTVWQTLGSRMAKEQNRTSF